MRDQAATEKTNVYASILCALKAPYHFIIDDKSNSYSQNEIKYASARVQDYQIGMMALFGSLSVTEQNISLIHRAIFNLRNRICEFKDITYKQDIDMYSVTMFNRQICALYAALIAIKDCASKNDIQFDALSAINSEYESFNTPSICVAYQERSGSNLYGTDPVIEYVEPGVSAYDVIKSIKELGGCHCRVFKIDKMAPETITWKYVNANACEDICGR